jgi:hypothetical protein
MYYLMDITKTVLGKLKLLLILTYQLRFKHLNQGGFVCLEEAGNSELWELMLNQFFAGEFKKQ